MTVPEVSATVELTPVLRYPRHMEAGRKYFLSIDLEHAAPRHWPETWPEEYVVYCRLESLPAFNHERVGDGSVVLHRFGGTYGPARFLIEPNDRTGGPLRVVLLSERGLPLAAFQTEPIKVVKAERPARQAGAVVEARASTFVIKFPASSLPSWKRWSVAEADEPGEYLHRLARSLPELAGEGSQLEGLPLARLVGKELFSQLLDEKMRRQYQSSLRGATDASLNVRLLLPPELESVPWELLYHDADHDPHFLAADPRTCLARYQAPTPGQPKKPPAAAPPDEQLRVLVVLASPQNAPATYRINLRAHEKLISRFLKPFETTGEAKLVKATGNDTLERLEDRLKVADAAKLPFHLVHVVCHGDVDDGSINLHFTNRAGETERVSLDRLNSLFARYPDALADLRLVILNASHSARGAVDNPSSSLAAEFVRRGAHAVVGMQFAVSDSVAQELTAALYTALIDQQSPIDRAMAAARHELFRRYPDSAAWLIPTLLLHQNAPPPLGLLRPADPQPGGVPAFLQARGLMVTSEEQVNRLFDLREPSNGELAVPPVPLAFDALHNSLPLARMAQLAGPERQVVAVPPGFGKTTLRKAIAGITPVQLLPVELGVLKGFNRSLEQYGRAKLVLQAALEALFRGLEREPQRANQLRGQSDALARLWALGRHFAVDDSPLPGLAETQQGREHKRRYRERREDYTLENWLDELWQVSQHAGYARGFQLLIEDEQRDKAERTGRDAQLLALVADLADVRPNNYQFSFKLFLTASVYERLRTAAGGAALAELPSYQVRPWDGPRLVELIANRMRDYSKAWRTANMHELAGSLFAGNVERPYPRLAEAAGGSPQEFLKLLRRIIERHSSGANALRPIGEDTFTLR